MLLSAASSVTTTRNGRPAGLGANHKFSALVPANASFNPRSAVMNWYACMRHSPPPAGGDRVVAVAIIHHQAVPGSFGRASA